MHVSCYKISFEESVFYMAEFIILRGLPQEVWESVFEIFGGTNLTKLSNFCAYYCKPLPSNLSGDLINCHIQSFKLSKSNFPSNFLYYSLNKKSTKPAVKQIKVVHKTKNCVSLLFSNFCINYQFFHTKLNKILH